MYIHLLNHAVNIRIYQLEPQTQLFTWPKTQMSLLEGIFVQSHIDTTEWQVRRSAKVCSLKKLAGQHVIR